MLVYDPRRIHYNCNYILLFMFKLFTVVWSCFMLNISIHAQSPYKFVDVSKIKTLDVEDQCATGTCWSFATISFLEAEVLRMGKTPVDLSEMFNVRMTYPTKASSFLRFDGKQQFGPGGLSHDVISVVKNYGVIPENAYSGLKKGNTEHQHGTLDELLAGMMKTILDKKLYQENEMWVEAVEGVLDAYLGDVPNTFVVNGKEYNPITYRDALGIQADKYINLTSFSHHPFYEKFVLEVPDNWSKEDYYNLPLDELQLVIDNALDNGFTVAWDADVSEKFFSHNNGVAIVPEKNLDKDEMFKEVVAEKKIDQEFRQKAFDTGSTTDDHLMHITGKAKDQNGTIYYKTKNSWGTTNPYGGYLYVSPSYLRYKTVGIVVHSDAIPDAIKQKIGLK